MSIPRNLSKLAEGTSSSGILGVAYGGTGGSTAADAKTALGLHAVATSGSYADLLNKPTILSTVSQDTAPQLGGSLTTTGHNIRGGPYEANAINLDVNASISAVRNIGGENGGVIVGTGTGNTADKFWIFNYAGGLKFPDSTTQTTAWLGTYSYTDLTNKPTIPSITGLASETYVNTQISNLVASAPATLDTLNELATALGNDANFSTTVTTALGNRLRIDVSNQALTTTQKSNAVANLGLATVAVSGSYEDLTNKPTITDPTDVAISMAIALG